MTDSLNKIIPHIDSYAGSALQFLGGALALDKLKEHLSSQVIGALMTIEEHKLYEIYGYRTFKEFLDKSELSPVSKGQFYRLRELYLKEGPEQYDLFTNWKVPLKTRKLLETGDIAIEGDEVVIAGEERVSLTNSGSIKAILERLVKEKLQIAADLSASEAKTRKLETVQKKYDELQREIDEANERSEFAEAYLKATEAMLTLIGEVKILDLDEKEFRVGDDLNYFAELWQQLHEAYGVHFEYQRRDGSVDEDLRKIARA